MLTAFFWMVSLRHKCYGYSRKWLGGMYCGTGVQGQQDGKTILVSRDLKDANNRRHSVSLPESERKFWTAAMLQEKSDMPATVQ